jgi:hypothetical protein
VGLREHRDHRAATDPASPEEEPAEALSVIMQLLLLCHLGLFYFEFEFMRIQLGMKRICARAARQNRKSLLAGKRADKSSWRWWRLAKKTRAAYSQAL